MADEREDERYDGEEGEYHFSEDQVNYEMDQHEEKLSAPGVGTAGGGAASFLKKITPARRAIIGGVVFVVLLSVVFKMLMPTSVPTTDFMQTAANKPNTAAHPPQAPEQVAASNAKNAEIATGSTVSQPVPEGVAQQTTGAPVSAPPQAAVTTASTSPPAVLGSPAGSLPAAPSAPSSPPSASPALAEGNLPAAAGQPPVPPEGVSPAVPMQPIAEGSQPASSLTPATVAPPEKGIAERIASLEQENAAMMNLLRTEYAPKLSGSESQDAAMQSKVDDLTKRMGRLEASLNQISQLIQNTNKPTAMASTLSSPPPSAAYSHEMKPVFTVQAIIPGRAWLKSEAGETVTVAEGDLLRNYGRITKIDPYDGIVNIDTGNKVVTLSYGIGAD